MKNKKFDLLIEEMGKCERCLNMKCRDRDCSLINIYQNKKFAKNIPSMWTDWYNRLDAKIMIVGQDWGPYKDMEKLHYEYLNGNKSLEELIESEKSLTKKMLEKYLLESAKLCNKDISRKYIDNIYITNAIMCARKGGNYRGDNIKLKECTLNCMEFLEKQIEIVKPKVILTLGFYPLLALSNIYKFIIPKTLGIAILENPIIELESFTIVPLYHPTAQISKDKQLEQYMKIWEYID